jgi:hypothetical protein
MDDYTDEELECLPGVQLAELAVRLREDSPDWNRVWGYMTDKYRKGYRRMQEQGVTRWRN